MESIMRLPSLKGCLALFRGENGRSRQFTENVPIVEVDAELAELIPQYLSSRWADLAFARQLFKSGDYFLLSRTARRIRDGAISHGFAGLGDIAKALEAAADQSDAKAVRAQLEAYDAFLRSVRIDYV